MRRIFFLSFLLLITAALGRAQSSSTPDPKVAFLKSMAVPGWGHHYVDKSNWQRGKFHLGIDAALILSYVGLRIYRNNVQHNWYTYGQSKAGVPIKGRSRNFQIAVGNYENLDAYNDYQLRNRQWNQLIKDTPKNSWNWSNKSQRSRYKQLRDRYEGIDNQLPAILRLMVLNRVISWISAFNRAKKKGELANSRVYVTPYRYQSGIVANLKIRF